MPRKSKKRKSKLPPKADWMKPEPLKKDDLLIRIFNQTSPIPDNQGQYDGISPEQRNVEKLKVFKDRMNDMSEKVTDYYKSKAIESTDIDSLQKLSPHAQLGYIQQKIRNNPELLNDPEFSSRLSPEFLNMMRGEFLRR